MCEMLYLEILKHFRIMFLNVNSQKLNMPSSTEHNVIKGFSESGEISVHKGKGQTTVLDTCDRCRIENRHDSVIDITPWAQEYFQKSLSQRSPCHQKNT